MRSPFIAFLLLTFFLYACSSPSVPENVEMPLENLSYDTYDLDSVVEEVPIVEELVVEELVEEDVLWQYNAETTEWEVIRGEAPECLETFSFPSPVDITLASGVLYPGQLRSDDYKPHGGFRFDTLSSNALDVYAPFDASLIQVAQHLEGSEIQYTLYFIHDCGLVYKLDHLLKLTPEYEKIMESIPMGGQEDTRTSFLDEAVLFQKALILLRRWE